MANTIIPIWWQLLWLPNLSLFTRFSQIKYNAISLTLKIKVKIKREKNRTDAIRLEIFDSILAISRILDTRQHTFTQKGCAQRVTCVIPLKDKICNAFQIWEIKLTELTTDPTLVIVGTVNSRRHLCAFSVVLMLFSSMIDLYVLAACSVPLERCSDGKGSPTKLWVKPLNVIVCF